MMQQKVEYDIQDQNGNERRIRVLFNIHLLTDDEKKKRDEEE